MNAKEVIELQQRREKWKKAERHAEVAQFFLGTRIVSKGMEAGDVSSPLFRIEWAYYRTGSSLSDRFYSCAAAARDDGKLPVLAVSDPRRKGFLVVCHTTHLFQIAKALDNLKRKGILPPDEKTKDLPPEEKARRHAAMQEEIKAAASVADALQKIMADGLEPEDAIF